MTLTEVIQKDGQRYLYVKSTITSGATQYKSGHFLKILINLSFMEKRKWQKVPL